MKKAFISIIVAGLILVNHPVFAKACSENPKDHPKLLEALRNLGGGVLPKISEKVTVAHVYDPAACEFITEYHYKTQKKLITVVVDATSGKIVGYSFPGPSLESLIAFIFVERPGSAEAVYEELKRLKPQSSIEMEFYEKFIDMIELLIRRSKEYNYAISLMDRVIASNEVFGTGVVLKREKENEYPVVSNVEALSPAKKEGIQAGDRVIELNGKSPQESNLSQFGFFNIGGRLVAYELYSEKNNFVNKPISERDTEVVFLIERNGIDKPFEKKIKRGKFFTQRSAAYFGMRSILYREIGDMQKALEDAHKAYSINPADIFAKLAMGAFYLDQGRYEEASKVLDAPTDYKELFDRFPVARILMATLHAKQGRFNDASRVYGNMQKTFFFKREHDRLLQMFKDYAISQSASAQSLEKEGKYKEALSKYAELLKMPGASDEKGIWASINRVIKKNPQYASISEDTRKYLVRAEVLVKDGKFEDAVKEYKKALELSPFTPEIYFNSALVYGETKNYPDAIRYMNIYLYLAPEASNARQAKDKVYEWEMLLEKKGE